jgi:D-glycero-alpha-D-manno-heptose 1-phosphate guanylyltransferase
MINNEIVILAGGLGTRLRSVVSDMPKCMAPINGRPFLSIIIDDLISQGVKKIIFSLGYMHQTVTQFLESQYAGLNYIVVTEDEPLGTGGAIKLALSKAEGENIVILNGDTIFRLKLEDIVGFHAEKKSVCTIALKEMSNIERYGVVDINQDDRIVSFREKSKYDHGYINGGVYLLNRKDFLLSDLPNKFSFEIDYLQKFYEEKSFYGKVTNGFFIDIGVPADFELAQKVL